MEMRQDDFMNCVCEYDQGFRQRALPRCPQLQVIPKQSKDKCQNWARDTSTQHTSQTKSSYYASCYPRQTSEKSSVQRQRIPPQRKREEKRSSEEFLATVCLSRPTENLLSSPSPCNQNQLAFQFHLEPPLATNDSLGFINKATQTEKSGPSCWSKLLKKLSPTNSKRQKPSREVSQEFQIRPVNREDEKKTRVNFFKQPEMSRRASELNGHDLDIFQDDSCTEFRNYMASKSPSMITHHRPSVAYNLVHNIRNKRSSCCCICEEEEECPCKCCCYPCAVLVDANLQTCCAQQKEEKVVQTEARKRECCKCCRCCRAAQNNHLQEIPKAKNAKPMPKNELVDLGQPKIFSQVNRLELVRPRNVAVSRGVDILQEYLLNTMSLDAANNAYANNIAEKQAMAL